MRTSRGSARVISKARLDKAAADATKQLDSLRNGEANPARTLADGAYSLWYYDYDELMQLGRYFTRREHPSRGRNRGPGAGPRRGRVSGSPL